MSMALAKVRFLSCSNFFCRALLWMPMTSPSRMSESRKQAQKLHVFANVRRAVMY